MSELKEREAELKELDAIVIRFAGDSGDGMQLTGTQFTNTSAVLGNDISTFPDFPAEIRAPAGTLAGVSGFQVMFARDDILTPSQRETCKRPAMKSTRWMTIRCKGTRFTRSH